MSQFCHSCMAPLDMPGMKGKSDTYCKYCTDGEGNLRSPEEVQKGIAHWLQQWQGDIADDVALERAGHFTKGMQAWAER